jgi:uncharacterized membrane protein YagU involved in acid resistance
MTLPTTSHKRTGSGMVMTVLITGLIAGILDITAALVHAYVSSGTKPIRVFQFIASGLFGKDAFMNESMAIWGCLIHFCIAITWTTFYFVVLARISILAKHTLVAGFCFGVMVWASMNYLVLPMTQVPQAPFNLTNAMIGAGILIVALGIPVAWSAKRYYSTP